jgi:hypothetical protein
MLKQQMNLLSEAVESLDVIVILVVDHNVIARVRVALVE